MKEVKNTPLQETEMHGIDKSNMDLAIKPGEDFYEYACGGWKKSNPLPSDHARFGVFDLMRDNNSLRLKELITTLGTDPQSKIPGTIAQKISDIYSLGMDSNRRNSEAEKPILPYLEKIKNYTVENLASELGYVHQGLIGGIIFGCGIGPDPLDSDSNILHVGETGLMLGDRDYYLEENENNTRILLAYEKYVKRNMELIGYSPEAQQRVWENIIFIEKQIAANTRTREERRDPQRSSNPMTISELKKLCPDFDWDRYFVELSIETDKLNVVNPKYLQFLNDFLPSLTDQQLQDYMIMAFLDCISDLLSDDFFEASFELFGKVMSGTEEPRPRWKRVMSLPNSMLGEAVGELYVKKYFPPDNKAYMVGLVENLRDALGQHIRDLTWMTEQTKEKALQKLSQLKVKIGYPDKWKDYTGIEIDPQKSYFENVLNACIWYTRDNFQKLNKPVDKTEWHMTPQTVNAYYSPISNEICFPAGILQPPYFDPTADDALNYGGIGVVIGHEMTHGFDDQGRHFDAKGDLSNWWQPEDSDAFNKLADKLVEQFDKVEVAPGVHANGRFTLGENIADQGGLRIALTAYQKASAKEKPEVINGFTPLQRFYLSYAQIWAGNIRTEEILSRTKTDPHSLEKNRVNETLRNIEPFFKAFQIEPEAPMFRPKEERVIIW